MNSNTLYILSSFLFTLGIFIAITKRHALFILIGIELILNAANINFVVWQSTAEKLDGQMAALFVLVIAVCETSVGLAIIIRAYQYFQTSVVDEIHHLNEQHDE